MDHSRFLSVVHGLHADARERGLYFQHHDGETDGRTIWMGGKPLLWFGSCSYMGIEHEPLLVEGAHEALRRHGTQFASSRGYVSLKAHHDLEAGLSEMFGGHALIGQTTTLGHISLIDTLITEKDALVMDHQVHASVQSAAAHARLRGATVELIRHEELHKAVERVEMLARKHDRVMFTTDGVTSMYGDVAPYRLLRELLDTAPNVWLYIDDAHGTGWAGKHGRGALLERFPNHPRIIVATSLAKSFAAGGAAMIFPNAELREQVRLCGSTMVFSGPLQPPLLGAALGSVALHLSPDLPQRQRDLWTRIRRLKDGIVDAVLYKDDKQRVDLLQEYPRDDAERDRGAGVCRSRRWRWR